MNLITAENYASKIYAWLLPHAALVKTCATLQVAGSIRRRRPICNDVDMVCIPRITASTDLLGNEIGRVNHALKLLQDYVAANAGKARFASGGEREGKQVIVELPKCQLDLWFAAEATFATRLVCRTGSREHNIWLASRAKRLGKKWNPYEGVYVGGVWRRVGDADVYVGGELVQVDSETALYRLLDLPFIDPVNRELPWLVQQFGKE